MTGTRHGQALGTVQGTQVQALVGDVELDLVHAQPLLHVLQVLLLDEHALFGQTGGQIVMGEGDQGELVAVEAANVDTAVAARLHVQAGDGVGGVVVADAEDHTIQHVLQEVARPGHRRLGREFGKVLEPLGPAHRQLVRAAALFQQQVAGALVQRELEHARRQLAHQIHESAALHTDEAGLLHFGGITAGPWP